MRLAVLVGENTKARGELLESLRADRARRDVRDALRRGLVETLLYGNRPELIRSLDETMLGLRPKPATAVAA
jgi:hypothetical protein